MRSHLDGKVNLYIFHFWALWNQTFPMKHVRESEISCLFCHVVHIRHWYMLLLWHANTTSEHADGVVCPYSFRRHWKLHFPTGYRCSSLHLLVFHQRISSTDLDLASCEMLPGFWNRDYPNCPIPHHTAAYGYMSETSFYITHTLKHWANKGMEVGPNAMKNLGWHRPLVMCFLVHEGHILNIIKLYV